MKCVKSVQCSVYTVRERRFGCCLIHVTVFVRYCTVHAYVYVCMCVCMYVCIGVISIAFLKATPNSVILGNLRMKDTWGQFKLSVMSLVDACIHVHAHVHAHVHVHVHVA